jgi:hypothetical protein
MTTFLLILIAVGTWEPIVWEYWVVWKHKRTNKTLLNIFKNIEFEDDWDDDDIKGFGI